MAGYEKVSLAVQKANYAVKMYESVGFIMHYLLRVELAVKYKCGINQ